MQQLIQKIKDCLYCHSRHIQKNGVLPRGGQRYNCTDCHRHFTIGGQARGTYDASFKQQVAAEYCHADAGARDLAAKHHLSTSTIVQRAKKHRGECSVCISAKKG